MLDKVLIIAILGIQEGLADKIKGMGGRREEKELMELMWFTYYNSNLFPFIQFFLWPSPFILHLSAFYLVGRESTC